MDNIEEIVSDFCSNGYAVIENFLSETEVNDMKNEIDIMINKTDYSNKDNNISIFNANMNSQLSDDYFMNSGDKIRNFYESKAFNSNGELIVSKSSSLNKIGHALHWLNPVFKRITFSDKVKNVVKKLNFLDPVVVQSMYIFKNPGIGGEVAAHQDATFLHSKPQIRVLGLWFALEDATEENGCLWFVRGSHKKNQLSKQWIRNPSGYPAMNFTNDTIVGENEKFESVPVNKGSCVLIDGLVLHKSAPNYSRNPRPVYTFHIFDQNNAEWDQSNWLQPTTHLPFPSLFNN